MTSSLGVRTVTSKELKDGWVYQRPVRRDYIVLRELRNGSYEVLEPTPELMEKGGIYADRIQKKA